MDQLQAEQFIILLTRRFSFEKTASIIKLPAFLNETGRGDTASSGEFEFSWIKGCPRIRLLHLSFWRDALSARAISGTLAGREARIAAAAGRLACAFGGEYDLPLLRGLFRFNRSSGLWPVQFGIEFVMGKLPLVKVYLSVNGDDFPMDKFSRLAGLDYGRVARLLKGRKMDSVGLDLLPDGGHLAKFYPKTGTRTGLLYRIGGDSYGGSVKRWKKLPGGSQEDFIAGGSLLLPEYIRTFLLKNKCRISYVCAENNKRSVYFR